MPQQTIRKPLGEILKEAGLISSAQLAVALQDQKYRSDLRIGDIFELRGWIKRDVIEFFAEQWPNVSRHQRQKPIGYYFQQAGLLTAKQIQILLEEQAQAGMRIGALAVLRGWLPQKTLDLFLRYLAPEEYFASPYIKHSQAKSSAADQNKGGEAETEETGNLASSKPFTAPFGRTFPNTDADDIPWVD